MKLIGMLDSPYVRRVAVSLKLLNLPFEHLSISVFSGFDTIKEVNPVVKAPTLVTDEGVVLMESSLILDYAERKAAPHHTLMPTDLDSYAQAQMVTGIALAACEKTVQTVYEYKLRPAEKRHQPWLDRIHGQLITAFGLLEQSIEKADPWLFGDKPFQADITSAIAFRCSCEMLPGQIRPGDYPALAAFSVRAEAMDAFLAFPYPTKE